MTSPRFLLACCLPLGISLPVQADEADVVNLRATVTTVRDDNLFREPDRGGQKPRMDTITTTVAGIDFDKRLSLQRLIAHINWVDTRYSSNDYLDAGALHYDGKWLWAVGSRLTGELAADRSVAQNSFADFPGLRQQRQRNLRTTENQRLGLDFAANPSWHLVGGLSRQTVANDQPLPAENDVELDGASLGVKYTPASGNWLSFQTNHAKGRYTKRPVDAEAQSVQIDNEFTQTGQEFAASWQPTGHSAFTGRLEYVERRHPNFPGRNFSGWAGQLGYLYQYSAKTSFTATYRRSLNAFQEQASSYYVADDLALGARWAATSKIGVSALVGYAHREYRGAIASLAGARRPEDIGRVQADVSYQPLRWLELKAGLAAERRNSSDDARDYTDRKVLFSAGARF